MKLMQTASINREIGTVEILSKFGVTGEDDPYASPDASRIWEDPDIVENDTRRQLEELMGTMMLEKMQGQQQQQAAEVQAASEFENQRDEGNVQKAGPGPQGPPMPAVPMGA